MSDTHKVFVSFHHADQGYKDEFVRMMGGSIVDRSVHDKDIGDGLKTDTIRQRIRDDFIADATVTVVLVGKCTWQRKHVDWEIGSSLRATKKNSRCGLLGILLPTHPNYGIKTCDRHLLPPRLADNCGKDFYASIYDWSNSPQVIQRRIHHAFGKRGENPVNNRKQFGRNRSGDCAEGWTD